MDDQTKQELLDLCDAACNDGLSEDQFARLEALLASDAECQRYYLRYLALDTDLALTFGEPAPAQALAGANAQQVDSRRPSAGSGSTADSTRKPSRGAIVFGWLRGLAHDFVEQPLALAILVLAMISGGTLIWKLSQVRPPQPIVRQPEPSAQSPVAMAPPVGSAAPSPLAPPAQPWIAKLARTSNAVWEQPQPPVPGSGLKASQKLVLKLGLAEIVFNSGATVILEGPAELEVGGQVSGIRDQGSGHGGENACVLNLGKLVARVPQRAHGFTVATPTITIVDRGTQFGVRVKSEVGNPKSENFPTSDLRPPTSTHVQVFQGLVEVQRQVAQAQQPANPVPTQTVPLAMLVQLKAGEAITSLPESQPQKIEGNPTGYVRELPTAEPAEQLPLATWPKDSPLKPGDIVAAANAPDKFHLFKIDARTGEQKLLATGFPYRQAPTDHGLRWTSVAVEPDGNVLVGAQGLGAWDDGLLRIDPRSGEIKVLTRGGLLKNGRLTGLAVAVDGAIYATYDGAGHAAPDYVLQIDPATGKLTPLVRFGLEVTGVCFDAVRGDLLVSSATDATVGLVQLMPEPKLTSWNYDRSLGRFDSVAVNREGRVFVGTTQAIPYEGTAQILEVGRNASRKPMKTAQQPVKTFAVLPKNRRTWSPMTVACEADGDLLVGCGGELRQVYRVDTASGKVTVLSSGGLIQDSTFLAVVPGRPAAAGESTP